MCIRDRVSVFSMMISITLRIIPTLFLEAQKILKAQASRGVDFKEGKLQQKVTQIVSLLLPMFIISLRKAYDLADTMEVRGYAVSYTHLDVYKRQPQRQARPIGYISQSSSREK